ncbi:MAG: hypothetical protein WHS38_06955 [Thermodesulforhabdaceae bacterium]
MFKRLPKVFWLGMLILYGWFFLFFILETSIPGFPLMKFLGIPFCYIYNWLIGLWILNMLVAVLFYKAEEKREERKQTK